MSRELVICVELPVWQLMTVRHATFRYFPMVVLLVTQIPEYVSYNNLYGQKFFWKSFEVFFSFEKKNLTENSLFNRIYNFFENVNLSVLMRLVAGERCGSHAHRCWLQTCLNCLIFSDMNGFSMCAYVHVEASLQSRNLSSTMISKLKFILARVDFTCNGLKKSTFPIQVTWLRVATCIPCSKPIIIHIQLSFGSLLIIFLFLARLVTISAQKEKLSVSLYTI